MADEHDSEALAILRRVEPMLGMIQQDLSALRERQARFETKLDVVLPTLATKEQVARLEERTRRL